MGNTTTTQETTIPGAGGAEQRLQGMLTKLLQGQAGQLGDLSKIASGDFTLTEADKRLISDSLGFTRDIVSRDMASLSEEGQARLGENLTARGVQGSSFESVDRAILERDLHRQGANMLDQSRIEMGNAAMALPFQRAGMQLNANQALFQNILGAANPLLSGYLNERLAQQKTKQTQPNNMLGSLVQLGSLAAAPFTGGASLAIPSALSAVDAYGGGGAPGGGSLLNAFQSGVRQGGRG